MSADRYQRLEPLGAGGQAHTFRALDTRTGRHVALKELQLSRSDWKTFDLFERECQVLRSLDHPGIPAYLDTFAVEREGRYVLVMEMIEGTTLQRLLEEHHLFSEGELFLVLHQLLEVLDYLHSRQPVVIHRDVKPANLIRRSDNRLVLVDFGGVRLALHPEGGSTVIGTFGYMAPEQLHGDAGPAVDIYGLGATLAALACGQSADKLPRRGLAIDLDRALPKSPLRALLVKMLRPEPEQRLASVAAVRDVLARMKPSASPWQRASSRRKRAASVPDVAQDAELQLTKPVEPSGGVDEDDAATDEVADGTTPAILRAVGHLGVAALTLFEVVLLPLVFALLLAVWGKDDRRKLKLRDARKSVRRGLRDGRHRLRQLASGSLHSPRRQLPGPRQVGRQRGRQRARRRGSNR